MSFGVLLCLRLRHFHRKEQRLCESMRAHMFVHARADSVRYLSWLHLEVVSQLPYILFAETVPSVVPAAKRRLCDPDVLSQGVHCWFLRSGRDVWRYEGLTRVGVCCSV